MSGVAGTLGRRRLRWLAAALALLVIPSISLPIVAAGSEDSRVSQQEVVTARLDMNGGVREVFDETFLRLEGTGRMTVQQPTGIENPKAGPDSSIKTSDGTVYVSADVKSPQNPTSVYYGGDATVLDTSGTVLTSRGERNLPLKISTEMTFDGAKVRNLEDIRGKGGSFEMKIRVENITGQAREVKYKDSTSGTEVTDVGFVFIPLTVNIGPWIFEDDNWKDMEVEGATLSRNGKAWVVSSSNVLFPPTTPSGYEVRINGVTKDFSIDPGRIVAVPGIGTEQAASVQDQQELGGGATAQLYDALQQFLGGFEKLTSPTEGLPFAADGVDQIIKEGLFKLQDGIDSTVLPGVQDLYEGLVTLRDTVRDTLVPGLATIRDVLGGTNKVQPLCRDLPVNTAGGCTFSQEQLAEVPPNPAVRDTYAIAAAWDPKTESYIYERIQRTQAGRDGTDLGATFRNDDGTYLGSLYNWASMARFAVGLPTDADGDGIFADFGPFVWPDPDRRPELYTTAAFDVVARTKGSLLPGHTDTGGIGPNKDVMAVCEIVAAVNFGVPQASLGIINSETDKNRNRVHDKVEEACGPIPFEDLYLRDIFKDVAKNKFPVVAINFKCLGGLLAFFTGGDPIAACGPDKAAASSAAAAATLEKVIPDIRPPLPEPEFEGKRVTFPDLLTGPVTIDLPVGDVLAYNSNLGVNNAMENPAQLFLPLRKGDEPQRPPLLLPIQQSTCLTTGDAVEADTMTLNLGELLGLGCNVAYAGSLGTVEAATTAIGLLLSSPGWNFDNWLRGDPGYQTDDLANTDTGPKLNEVMNIITYQLDRSKAMCPATLVTDPDGSGTPRPVPPPLDTPCDEVKPDSTTSTDPDEQATDATMVGALSNLFLPGVGNPEEPKFEAGLPDDLATFLGFVSDSIGTDDPADVGVTLAGSLAAVRKGLSDAAVQLEPAVTGTPLLVGAVGNAQIEGDLNTALSKAGLDRADDWTSFQGLATFDGQDADGNLVFVFETLGLQT